MHSLKNNNSKHHKIILSLMKRNLYQIRSRIKKEKAKNPKSGKTEEISIFKFPFFRYYNTDRAINFFFYSCFNLIYTVMFNNPLLFFLFRNIYKLGNKKEQAVIIDDIIQINSGQISPLLKIMLSLPCKKE